MWWLSLGGSRTLAVVARWYGGVRETGSVQSPNGCFQKLGPFYGSPNKQSFAVFGSIFVRGPVFGKLSDRGVVF